MLDMNNKENFNNIINLSRNLPVVPMKKQQINPIVLPNKQDGTKLNPIVLNIKNDK